MVAAYFSKLEEAWFLIKNEFCIVTLVGSLSWMTPL